jgi:TrmH family RNA methyltransferase
VKQLLQLQKKAKERALQDVFVVEGIKMYQEVPKERLVQTYVSESFFRKNEALFDAAQQVTMLSDRVFESVSDTKTPQGILCLVRQYHYELRELYGACPLVMILENLQDPGNLGTILRTAEGAGVTGILLSEGCVDLYNPKVIRSTMGSVYRMPFCYSKDWETDLKALKAAGISMYAAHLKGTGPYDRQDYGRPTAFLIGNESKGLTDQTAAFADTYIRIPMCGQVESLNAAVASAVLMYEANRQRRQ